MGGNTYHDTPRPPMLTLAEYERNHPDWRLRLREIEEIRAREAEMRSRQQGRRSQDLQTPAAFVRLIDRARKAAAANTN